MKSKNHKRDDKFRKVWGCGFESAKQTDLLAPTASSVRDPKPQSADLSFMVWDEPLHFTSTPCSGFLQTWLESGCSENEKEAMEAWELTWPPWGKPGFLGGSFVTLLHWAPGSLALLAVQAHWLHLLTLLCDKVVTSVKGGCCWALLQRLEGIL